MFLIYEVISELLQSHQGSNCTAGCPKRPKSSKRRPIKTKQFNLYLRAFLRAVVYNNFLLELKNIYNYQGMEISTMLLLFT